MFFLYKIRKISLSTAGQGPDDIYDYKNTFKNLWLQKHVGHLFAVPVVHPARIIHFFKVFYAGTTRLTPYVP